MEEFGVCEGIAEPGETGLPSGDQGTGTAGEKGETADGLLELMVLLLGVDMTVAVGAGLARRPCFLFLFLVTKRYPPERRSTAMIV